MSFTDSLFGRPLATSEERAEHIGVAAGIPIFGLDALTPPRRTGPETALSLLIPLGLMGIQYIVPHHLRHPLPACNRVFHGYRPDDCGVSEAAADSIRM